RPVLRRVPVLRAAGMSRPPAGRAGAPQTRWPGLPGWSALAGVPVLVAGAGVSGEAAARALLAAGAAVTVTAPQRSAVTDRLAAAGARIAPGLTAPPDGTALVVTSPGLKPADPLLRAAELAGLAVIGEVELAWRLQPAGGPAWLALTGTNGKTTTV